MYVSHDHKNKECASELMGHCALSMFGIDMLK